jgi:hypothetical protein
MRTFDKHSFVGATIDLSASTLELRTGGAGVAWKWVKYIVSRSCRAYRSSRAIRTLRVADSFQGLLAQLLILDDHDRAYRSGLFVSYSLAHALIWGAKERKRCLRRVLSLDIQIPIQVDHRDSPDLQRMEHTTHGVIA